MGDVFVARQPIFTKNKQVFAYELLFRSSKEQTAYQELDGNKATAQVLENSLLEIGLAQLTKERPAFVNFPEEVLMAGFIEELPTELIVIEILESVKPTPEIVERCRQLKSAGFRFALDDFTFSEQYRTLVELADYIKIDFRLTEKSARRLLVEDLGRDDLIFLAEKVENYEEYQEAIDAGYNLMQGYFFSKPEVVGGKTIKLTEQAAFVFLQELSKDDMDYEVLEELVRHDVSLSYKILRLINAPYFGFSTKITSVRQALTLVGRKSLYKWVSLLLLSSLSADKPEELLNMALVRARFAELIGNRLAYDDPGQFFMGGMFSLIDAFLDRPMIEAVMDLPLLPEVKEGILGVPNTLGLVLQLTIAYEQADWNKVRLFALSLGLQEADLALDYYQATLWSGYYESHGYR